MKTLSFRRLRHRLDFVTLLILCAAVAVLVGRAAFQRPNGGSPYGRELPSSIVERLERLGGARQFGTASAPARLTIIEDFRCPASAAAHDSEWPLLRSLVENGRLAVTVHQLSLPGTDTVPSTAGILRCGTAGSRDGFWQLRSELLSRQNEWLSATDTRATMMRIADDAGADTLELARCVRAGGGSPNQEVAGLWEALYKAELGFTPIYVLNDRIVRWREIGSRVQELTMPDENGRAEAGAAGRGK